MTVRRETNDGINTMVISIIHQMIGGIRNDGSGRDSGAFILRMCHRLRK